MLKKGRNPLSRQLESAKAPVPLLFGRVTGAFAIFMSVKTGVKVLKSTLRSRRAVLVTICLLVPLSVLFSTVTPQKAQAATSSTITFQGRLLTNTGTTVPDGTYNMQFNLYTVSSGGSTQWTDSRLVNATQGITLKNGYFSVNLADTSVGGTAFPSTINWDQEQWLGLTVRGTNSCTPFSSCASPADAEMTPRFKLTAVPYAFAAGQALSVASYATSTASTASNNVTIQSGNATGTTSNSGNVTLNVGTATGTRGSISIGTTNAPSAITVGSTTTPFTIQGTSASVITGTNATFTTTFGFTTPTANQTYSLPNSAAGTYQICTTANNCTGLGAFIQNGTAAQNSANFNVQSAATGSVTAKFRLIASQTVDVLQVRDSGDTTTLFSVSKDGNILSTGQTTLGSATNQIQLIVKANASQSITNPLLVFQNSGGTETARINVFGTGNIGFGNNILNALTSGTYNVALGSNALDSVTNGGNNIAIGRDTLTANNSNFSVAIGTSALALSTQGANTAVGHNALSSAVNNLQSSAFGAYALEAATGNYNAAVGHAALQYSSGQENVALGTGAGRGVNGTSTFSYSTIIGSDAGLALTTGTRNTLLGRQAGTAISTQSDNVLLGYNAGNNLTTGTGNNILIGSGVQGSSATVANSLNIGDTIYGDLANDRIAIGTTTTSAGRLTVNNAATTDNIFVAQDNGVAVLTIGDGGNVLAGAVATGTTGTSSGAGNANTTSITLAAAGAFANNDIIFVDNTGGSGQDYYTRITAGGGTTTLTVSPAVSYGTNAGYTGNATITKYTAQNIGATSTDYTTQTNRFFQGYFLGGVVTGAGSTTLSDGILNSTTALALQTAGTTRLTVASGGAATFSSTLTVQGASVTVGTSSQQGSLILNDGNGGQTATLQVGNIAANTILTLPSTLGASDTLCFATLSNCTAVGTASGALTGSYPGPTLAGVTGTGSVPFQSGTTGVLATDNTNFTFTDATNLLTVNGGVKAGTAVNAGASSPALRVSGNGGGGAPANRPIAIKNDSDSDVRIFSDTGAYDNIGIYYKNSDDTVHFTYNGSTGAVGSSWTEYSSTGSGAITTYSKMQFTLSTGDMQVGGVVRANGGFNNNGTAGSTLNCAGQLILGQVVSGGITTGGSCSAAGTGTVTGTGTSGQVPYWNGTSSLTGTTNFTWTNASNLLTASGTYGGYQLRTQANTSTVELNIRPNSGSSGWLSFTESGVADRWMIGSPSGSGDLRFATGNPASNTTRLTVTSGGNATLTGLLTVNTSISTARDGTAPCCSTYDLSVNATDNPTIQFHDSGAVYGQFYFNSSGYFLYNASTASTTLTVGNGSNTGRLNLWGSYLQDNGGGLDIYSGDTQVDIYDGLYVSSYGRFDGGVSVDGNTVIDDGAGWHRTYGDTGWYNQTYGGGFYMTDTSWVRAYNGKGIWTSNQVNASSVVAGEVGWSSGTQTWNDACYNDAYGYHFLTTCGSLASLKHNIANISYGIETLRQLTPRQFNWNLNDEADIGFIAEEITAVDPIFGQYNGETGALTGVKYKQLTALLTKSVQQLDVQVQSIDARLAVIESGEFVGDIHVNGNAIFDGTLTVTGNTTVNQITVNGKIITAGNAPTASVGVVSGVGAAVTVAGNDTAGNINYTTGTASLPGSPVAVGEQLSATFTSAYGAAPRIALTPKNEKAASVRYFVETTTTGFTLQFIDAPDPSTQYLFDYIIIQ